MPKMKAGRILGLLCSCTRRESSLSDLLRVHTKRLTSAPRGGNDVRNIRPGSQSFLLPASSYGKEFRLSSTRIDVEGGRPGDVLQSLAHLKERLFRSAAGVNRGFSCREGESKSIMEIVEQLEGQNPNMIPNKGFQDGTSILAGEWKLLFTSALDVLSLGLLPGIEPGQIFQNISKNGKEIANVVELQPKAAPIFARFVGSTSAKLKVLAASSVEGDKRITLAFRSSQYSPQTLLGQDVSATLPPLKINLPQLPNVGWVDTTYVDDDIRVARAFGGNVFVLARI